MASRDTAIGVSVPDVRRTGPEKSASFLRERIGRGLLGVLIALMPLHAGLVAIGVPAVWKEIGVGLTLAIALTLPPRAVVGKWDYLALLYFAQVLLSAMAHGGTSISDLTPYLAYVPLAVVVPRLLVVPKHVATLFVVGGGSLLVNAAWMVAVQIGIVSPLNMLSGMTATPKGSGSLTGDALTTATLYGVGAGVAWVVAGAVSNHRRQVVMLAIVLSAAGALTGSRGALVACGSGVLLAIALMALRMPPSKGGRALVVYVVICLSIAAMIAAPLLVRADDSLRASRWDATLHVAMDHPLIGAGPGATSLSRAIKESRLEADVAVGYLPDDVLGTRVSESSVLKLAAEVGLPGLLAISLWVASTVLRTRFFGRSNSISACQLIGSAIVILMTINGLTYPNMESFMGAALFWLGVGLCRAQIIIATGFDRLLPT